MSTSNKIKKTFILCVFASVAATSQIRVKINGNQLAENQVVSASDIKKMEISLAKPVTLKPNSNGKARLYIELIGTTDKVIEGYTLEKEGYNATDQFLKDTKSIYTLYQEGAENKTFNFTMNAPPTLKAVLQQAATDPANKLVKVNVSLMFSDKKIDAYGVVRNGPRYDLIPVFKFNIKNESADGSIALLDVGSVFSSTIAAQLNYKTQEKYKGYFYGEINPLFTNPDVVKCNLQGDGQYLPVIFNIIDINNKTQDEYLTDLKNSFETFLRVMSNQCNLKIAENLPAIKYSYWGKVISYSNNNEYMIIPVLDGKSNKQYMTEAIMRPVELGSLKGLKFNSIMMNAHCTVSPEERTSCGHANVYFLKHPKNDKQVIMVFCYDKKDNVTAELVKKTDERVDLLLSSQKF